VNFVSGDGFLSLPGPFVNLRDAVKAISDERPGALDTLATLPVGKLPSPQLMSQRRFECHCKDLPGPAPATLQSWHNSP
jgi:hypothetical protein